MDSKEDNCDIEQLDKCIEFGDSICIELPQLTRLKQVSAYKLNEHCLLG